MQDLLETNTSCTSLDCIYEVQQTSLYSDAILTEPTQRTVGVILSLKKQPSNSGYNPCASILGFLECHTIAQLYTGGPS